MRRIEAFIRVRSVHASEWEAVQPTASPESILELRTGSLGVLTIKEHRDRFS